MTVALSAVVACAALVLAGTEAADDGTQSPNERFAESVCATTIPYERQMIETLEASVRTRATPGKDGWYDLYALIYRAESVALEYGEQIRALDIPDIQAKAKIAPFLGWWSRRPRQRLNEERHRVFKLQRNFTLLQSIRGLNHFERDVLLFAITDISAGVVPYATHVAPDLADAFVDAPSCKKLDRVLNTRLK